METHSCFISSSLSLDESVIIATGPHTGHHIASVVIDEINGQLIAKCCCNSGTEVPLRAYLADGYDDEIRSLRAKIEDLEDEARELNDRNDILTREFRELDDQCEKAVAALLAAGIPVPSTPVPSKKSKRGKSQ